MAKMVDIAKLKAQMTKLQEAIAFQETTQAKYISMAEAVKKQITDAGLDLADVLPHLKAPSKARAPKGTAVKKVPASQDSTGKMHERGVTYKHSSIPEPWTSSGKRAPNAFVKLIKSGKTWDQMKIK